MQKPHPRLWPALVVLLSLLAAWAIFKVYLYEPNRHMYAFGGDALIHYYDIVYHVAHDHGTTLGGMNYPYGEYVFLTDAQGAVSSVLQWINHHIADIHPYVLGILHSLNIYLLPLCSLFVFYILRFFQVRILTSVAFAVLITFLSPAMLRFGAHFGLAYPFVIPMAMLWYLRKTKIPSLEWRDGVVVVILIFFTFNNPYIGFTANAFLFLAGCISLFFNRSNPKLRFTGIITAGAGLAGILIPYLNFHFCDPVQDRLREQWGFFYFHAAPEGLLYPPQSLVYIFLKAFQVKFEALEFEKYMNIGLVTSLVLLGMLITWIVRLFKKRSAGPKDLFKPLSVILITSIILFVYAANTSLVPLPETWIQEHLGPLLMFKAVSRIGWPVYFALTIWSVILFDRWLTKMRTVMVSNVILLVAAGTWTWEIHTYVGSHYHDCFHENFLRQELADDLIKNLDEHHIDSSTFQAMLVLPKMQAWTDNFLSDLNWASQFFSTRISAATGLPMINAMLSRMSIGQSAEAIQMLSNSLIRRDLVRKLPSQKDILLLVGGGHPPLKEGEDFLVHVSTPLFESPDYSLYRLRLKELENNTFMEEARKLALQHPPVPPDVIHLGFDETATPGKFYGTGARLMAKGTTTVVDQMLPCNLDTNYVFSAWTRIGHIKPGVGDWYITLSDSSGHIVMPATRIETRKSNDIQDMWIRSEMQFPVSKGTRIKADFVTDHDLYIDEIWIYPKGSRVLDIEDTGGSFLMNGFQVSKE